MGKKNNTVIDETNMKLLTGGRSNEQCKKNKRGTNSLLWFAVNVPKSLSLSFNNREI